VVEITYLCCFSNKSPSSNSNGNKNLLQNLVNLYVNNIRNLVEKKNSLGFGK